MTTTFRYNKLFMRIFGVSISSINYLHAQYKTFEKLSDTHVSSFIVETVLINPIFSIGKGIFYRTFGIIMIPKIIYDCISPFGHPRTHFCLFNN